MKMKIQEQNLIYNLKYFSFSNCSVVLLLYNTQIHCTAAFWGGGGGEGWE